MSVNLSLFLGGTIQFSVEDGFLWKFIVKFFLKKNVKEIQVSLKSEKNKGYFTGRLIYIFDRITLVTSWNENVSDKICIESQHTYLYFDVFTVHFWFLVFLLFQLNAPISINVKIQ